MMVVLQEPVGPVLCISFQQLQYVYNCDTIHSIFIRFGNVHRIIQFTDKNQQQKALVELDSIEAARRAKLFIDENKKFFDDNGLLRFELKVMYSDKPWLNITHNCEKSRDYTRQNAVSNSMDMYHVQQHQRAIETSIAQNVQALGKSPVLHVRKLDYSIFRPEDSLPNSTFHATRIIFNLFDYFRPLMKIKIIFKRADEVLVQFQSVADAEFVKSNLNGVRFFSQCLDIQFSVYQQVLDASSADAVTGQTLDCSGFSQRRYTQYTANPVSNVLEVSNLPPGFAVELRQNPQRLLQFFPPTFRITVQINDIIQTATDCRVIVTFPSGQALAALAYSNYTPVFDGRGSYFGIDASFVRTF